MGGLRGTGSLAQAAVGAHGGLAGEGSSQGPLPTGWGNTDSFPSGAWCLWSTCEGRLCAMARAQQQEGRGVLPRRRLVPMEVLWGMAVPNSPGPPAGRTGSPAWTAVGAYGVLLGDSRSQRAGPTSWGDKESCPGVGRCLWRACAGWQFPTARAHHLGGRGVLPKRGSSLWRACKEGQFPTGPPAKGSGSPFGVAVGLWRACERL